MAQATAILGGRYELGPVLGQGGMARVHRGTDRQLRRPVAVKVLSPPYDRDRAFVERFRREAHAAARLNHPNIVAVYDSGSDDGTHYIVTELVEGETLGDVLAREGALPPERAVGVSTEVCRALAAAHQGGVVHRDIKPGNVMLTADGRVKVVDFGIARAAGAESVTRTGQVLGSATCVSPEQARGEAGDERSDIYSLGCVLYHTLTGRPPFVADSPISAMYQHVNEPVVPPSSIGPVSASLEAVVLRCLEKDPSDRFASAAELEGALEAAVTEGGPASTMPLPVAAAEETVPGAAGEETVPVQRVEPAPGRLARLPWRTIGLVVAALLVLAMLALAFGPVDLPSRREARRAAREARQDVPAESPAQAIAEEPPTVDEAYVALVSVIEDAEGEGLLDGKVADDLVHRADEVMKAYGEGDAEKVQKELDELGAKLFEAIERGDVSDEVADLIGAALSDLAAAIDADPPEAVVDEPVEEDDDGGGGHGGNGEDGGNEGQGGGPPDHAEGNGKGHD